MADAPQPMKMAAQSEGDTSCRRIGILFTIGGDGTLRGGQAIAGEVRKRGLEIAVVGVPKTIDNDISYVERSFGFETAVTAAGAAILSAHTEATGARNGVGLVKLMGRESGFIAAFAAIAYNDVNYCLIPELPFTLDGLLQSLEERLNKKGHAVIVVGEGAGQDLMQNTHERDASGNIRFGDIGSFLRDQINVYFKGAGKRSTSSTSIQLHHTKRSGQCSRFGLVPPSRPKCGPCRDGGTNQHGGRRLERRTHPRTHSHGGIQTKEDRSGRLAMEYCPCINRSAGDHVMPVALHVKETWTSQGRIEGPGKPGQTTRCICCPDDIEINLSRTGRSDETPPYRRNRCH